jgi:hypothetical protein
MTTEMNRRPGPVSIRSLRRHAGSATGPATDAWRGALPEPQASISQRTGRRRFCGNQTTFFVSRPETRKRRFASECVVVDAVCFEPISASKLPDNRGKYREFRRSWADFTKASALGCNDFNALQCDFPTQPIREFFQPSRETAGSNFRRTGNLGSKRSNGSH